MFKTGYGAKMVDILSSPERRRRRTPQEKVAIIKETMEPGMTGPMLPVCTASMRIRSSNGAGSVKRVRWRQSLRANRWCLYQNLPLQLSKSGNCRVCWGKRPWKWRPSKRPWSMAAQKNGLRTRPCCPGTTINRRQPLLRRIACAAQSSYTSFSGMGGSPLSASV